MYNTIITSAKINFKSLRMSMLNYIMLVIIFPATYLVIALASSSGRLPVMVQVSGVIMSMIFSLFINMQASLIANSNDITVRETYAVYNVDPVFVYAGQCLFHLALSLPIILVGGIIVFVTVKSISVIALTAWVLLTFMFLSAFSILLGTMLNNPQIAGPVINVIYMIVIAITPLYNAGESVSFLYLINPLTHILNLFRMVFGAEEFCSPIVSGLLLLVLTVVMCMLIRRILQKRTGNEKQNIF